MVAQRIIAGYARMWPRDLLNIRIMIGTKAKPHPDIKAALQCPSVYVLYQDVNPYYVGKTWNLFRRLWRHANNSKSEYFNFWNFFSFLCRFNSCISKSNRRSADNLDAHGKPLHWHTEDQHP
jgi:hypothetical protein